MFDDVQRRQAEEEQWRAQRLAQQEREANEYAEMLRDFVATARRLGVPPQTVIFFQEHVGPRLFSNGVRVSHTEVRRTAGWGPFVHNDDRSLLSTCVTQEGRVENIFPGQLKGVVPGQQFTVVIPDPEEARRHTPRRGYLPTRDVLERFLASGGRKHWG